MDGIRDLPLEVCPCCRRRTSGVDAYLLAAGAGLQLLLAVSGRGRGVGAQEFLGGRGGGVDQLYVR